MLLHSDYKAVTKQRKEKSILKFLLVAVMIGLVALVAGNRASVVGLKKRIATLEKREQLSRSVFKAISDWSNVVNNRMDQQAKLLNKVNAEGIKVQ